MTFTEAKKLLAKTDAELICVQVESWLRGCDSAVPQFSIWDGDRHFRGDTLDAAVLAFLRHHPLPNAEESPEPNLDGAFAEMGAQDSNLIRRALR